MKNTSFLLALLLLASALLLVGCGAKGDKITEEAFVAKLAEKRAAYDESKLVSMSSSGSTTVDYNVDVEEKSYTVDYTQGTEMSDAAADVMAMAMWDLSDIKARTALITDAKLEWKFYENAEDKTVTVTAFFSETFSLDGNDYENRFEFEYRFNEYGLLIFAKEYVTAPSIEIVTIENNLTTNLQIEWTFAD